MTSRVSYDTLPSRGWLLGWWIKSSRTMTGKWMKYQESSFTTTLESIALVARSLSSARTGSLPAAKPRWWNHSCCNRKTFPTTTSCTVQVICNTCYNYRHVATGSSERFLRLFLIRPSQLTRTRRVPIVQSVRSSCLFCSAKDSVGSTDRCWWNEGPNTGTHTQEQKGTTTRTRNIHSSVEFGMSIHWPEDFKCNLFYPMIVIGPKMFLHVWPFNFRILLSTPVTPNAEWSHPNW